MKTQILIVTYAKDIRWLEWNLRSIRKFATGFSGVTLVCPRQERAAFEPLAQKYGCDLRDYHRSPNERLWHLQAQAQKCMADVHCPEADFILHTDSDCLFIEPVAPDDYFVDGRPVMLIEEFARLANRQWKPVVDFVLKADCKYETMRRHPQVNPRGIYPMLRRWIELMQRKPFEEFVLAQKADFPWGFTEHNVIGNFALQADNKAYYWIDVGKEPWPKPKLVQFWSLGSPDVAQPSPHDSVARTPAQFVEAILA